VCVGQLGLKVGEVVAIKAHGSGWLWVVAGQGGLFEYGGGGDGQALQWGGGGAWA